MDYSNDYIEITEDNEKENLNDVHSEQGNSENEDDLSSILQSPVEKENINSQHIIQSKIDFENRIQAKDEEDEKRKADLEKEAKLELQRWYDKHEDQLAQRKEINREEQSAVQAQLGDTSGNPWTRVCRFIDFGSTHRLSTPSTPSTKVLSETTSMARDTSRLRNILLQLKTNPLVR